MRPSKSKRGIVNKAAEGDDENEESDGEESRGERARSSGLDADRACAREYDRRPSLCLALLVPPSPRCLATPFSSVSCFTLHFLCSFFSSPWIFFVCYTLAATGHTHLAEKAGGTRGAEGAGSGKGGAGGEKGVAGGEGDDTAGAQVSANPPSPSHPPRTRRERVNTRPALPSCGDPSATDTCFGGQAYLVSKRRPALSAQTVSSRNLVETVELQLGQKPAILCVRSSALAASSPSHPSRPSFSPLPTTVLTLKMQACFWHPSLSRIRLHFRHTVDIDRAKQINLMLRRVRLSLPPRTPSLLNMCMQWSPSSRCSRRV